MDPTAFVRQLAPFEALPDDAFAQVGAALEVVYEPTGTVLLTRGGAPSGHLWIVRKGRVELRRDGEPLLGLETGDWFGFPSSLADEPPTADAVVVEDALLYRVPGAVLRPLLAYPSVTGHVAGGLAARLRATAGGHTSPLHAVPVRSLVTRLPVVLPPTATARDAAARMREEGISSVVVAGDPPGLVTDRQLRDTIVADDRPTSTPLDELADREVPVIALDATISDALDALLSTARHHLLVTGDGTPHGHLEGVVTTGDLLRRDADSPVHLVRVVARTRDPVTHATVTRRAPRLVAGLLAAGTAPDTVLRGLSALTDAATRSAIAIAVEELGDPGVPFAWLALGSHARREQTLLTDQDSALVHAAASPPEVAHLLQVAERVVDLLEAAGLPRCRGGTMAPSWHGELTTWLGRLQDWVRTPDPDALYRSAILLDLRPIAGDLDVLALQRAITRAGRDGVFLSRMASAAATARPAVGWFHRLREDREGRVDLKAGGVTPITDLARLLALQAGEVPAGTLDRLAVATRHGLLSTEGHDVLCEAYGFLQRLRLRAQVDAVDADGPLTNHVQPRVLTPLDRRHLQEVLAAVVELQRAVLDRLGADTTAR